MKPKMIALYMDICKRISQMSVARRAKVGGLIVKNNNILSFGWNGTPYGWDNNCETQVSEYDEVTKSWYLTDELKTNPEVLHAEMNAISKLARSTESGDGATMFITHSPCIECAKLIHQSGIKEVYYGEDYRDDMGIKFLEKSKVLLKKIG